MAQDWLAGETVACPACGTALQIPHPTAAVQWESLPDYSPSKPVYLPPAVRSAKRKNSGEVTSAQWIGICCALGGAAALFLILVSWNLMTRVEVTERFELPEQVRPRGMPSHEPPPVETAAEDDVPRSSAEPIENTVTSPAREPPPWLSEPWQDITSEPLPSQEPPHETHAPLEQPANVGQENYANASASPPADVTVPTPSAEEALYAAFGQRSDNGNFTGARPVKGEDYVLNHYSWMCELLPFLGHSDIYDQFDFRRPWHNENNLQLTGEVIQAFINPADDRTTWKGLQFRGMAMTHFVGMSGVEDRRNVVAAMLPRSDPRAGIFGYDQILKPDDITDGTSQTIMVIGAGKIIAPWVQGGGATIRGAREPHFDPLTGFGTRGLSTPGAAVMMADGSTRHLSADIDPHVFRALCTAHGSDSVDHSHLIPVQGRFPGVPSR